MFPTLFSIGPIHVFSYGVMIALGLAIAFFIIQRRGVVYGFQPEQLMDLIIMTTVVGIVCARVLYVLRFWDQYAGDLFSVVKVWEGGLIFYGGAIGATLFLLLYTRVRKQSFAVLTDAIVPYFVLVHAFGRIGCFLNGCCYGCETSLPIGVCFPGMIQGVHPTQLYSSAFCFGVFGLLFFLSYRSLKAGAVTTLYFIIYPIGRFFIEFLRVNPPVFAGLSHAQVTSVVCVVVASVVFVKKRYWEIS